MNYPRALLLLFLIVAIAACSFLLSPYIYPILIAFILGSIFNPIQTFFEKKLPSKPNLCAALTCTVLTFAIFIPVAFLSFSVFRQGIEFVTNVNHWAHSDGPAELLRHPFVQKLSSLTDLVPKELLESEPEKLLDQFKSTGANLGKSLVDYGGELVGNISQLVVDFSLMIFVFYFVVRDHDKLISQIRHALPLSRSQEDILLTELREVAKSALLGSLLTALCQGIAGGFILLLAGLPGLFWGAIMSFAALIPVVGTALIWVPAAIYLFATGDTTWAIIVSAWCILVVGSIDNFLRPIFMQGASSMSTIIVFFALLGGLHAFGLAGLIFGPLVFGMTLVLFRMYEQEFDGFLQEQDRT